jgi:hypothetical protein
MGPGSLTQQVYDLYMAMVMEGRIHTEQRVETIVSIKRFQGQGFELARSRVDNNGEWVDDKSKGGMSIE